MLALSGPRLIKKALFSRVCPCIRNPKKRPRNRLLLLYVLLAQRMLLPELPQKRSPTRGARTEVVLVSNSNNKHVISQVFRGFLVVII